MPEGLSSLAGIARALLEADEPFRAVGAVVGAEVALLLSVTAAAVLASAWGALAGVVRRAVEHRYGIYVMEASIEKIHDDSPILRAPPIARTYIRGLLLSKILRIGGAGRRTLADLYSRMGFIERDVAGLSSLRWSKRVESCVAVGLAGGPALAPRLRPLLSDRREAVRIAAARGLSRLEGAAAVPAMVAAMAQASEWGASRITEMISSCGGAALDHVKSAIESCPGGEQRARLTDILGAIGDARAIPILLGLLREGDLEIRIRAAKSLGIIPDRRSAVALSRALDDESWEVRAQAAKSLGKVGDPETIAALAGRLDDRNWWVRFNSAYALAAMGEPGRAELREIVAAKGGFARDIAAQVLEMAAQGVLEQ